jgi:glycosyltransferase involved in cell wall biosynthesis
VICVAARSSNSTLTVAVPTYNGARHVGEALRGVLAQEGVAFDLLVCDDRSSDDTLGVVRTVAGDRAQIVVNSERLGLAGNWNQCVALAQTPLVAIFHQDDVMLPGHLRAHAAALASDEAVALAASAAVAIDELGALISPDVVNPGGLGPFEKVFGVGELAREMARGNPLRCSAVTIRTAAHREVGGFSPSLLYVVDWDFWLRVARRWKVAWLAAPTVRFRWHAASESQRFTSGMLDLEESGRLLEDLFATDWKDQPDVAVQKKDAYRRLGRAYLNRAHAALRGGHPELARLALRRGFECSPAVIAAILRDPRLWFQMTALVSAPKLAGRFFGPKT